MYVVGGSSSNGIDKKISEKLGYPLANLEIKRFVDGEYYVRIMDDISNEDVVIVQTTYPDNNIIEMFLLQDAVAEAGAKSIYLIIPYYGYSRQDKKFEDGEPISARAMARHLSINADAVIVVDPHKEHILRFFDIPAFSCTAIPQIAKFLKGRNIDIVIAPDKGAKERARMTSEYIKSDYDFLEKTRIDDRTIEIKTKRLAVTGKNIAIVDDIISTGGTMARVVEELRNQGARDVYVVCTHGLFVANAIEKLRKAGSKEIVSTDTILTNYSHISVAPAIADLIRDRIIG